VGLGFKRKLYIAKCVTIAISWLHENGTKPDNLHLRLKPSNILFTNDWKVKVADYGLGLPQAYFGDLPETQDILFKYNYAHYSAPEIFLDREVNIYTDGWSLGMIYYTLLLDKIPYQSAKSYEDLKTLIVSGKVPPLPQNTPPSLKKIITKCWIINYQKRQAPKDTVSSNPWSQIYKEALPASEELKSIWEKIALSAHRSGATAIPWDEFAPQFWKLLEMTIDPFKSEETLCLRLIISDSAGEVSRERFEYFTKNFSPFRLSHPRETLSYFSSIVKLCSQPWFYGIKGRSETEAILNELFYNKQVKNPVVVRLCENRNYQFCVCYIINSKEKKIQHTTYPPEEYEEKEFFPFLQSLVKSFDYKKGLKSANPFSNVRLLEKIAKEESPEMFQYLTSNFTSTLI